MSQIARHLNKKGITTPSEYNNWTHKANRWTCQAVKKTLTNIVYIGDMRNHITERKYVRGPVKKVEKEKWIINKNIHEAIITTDEYNAASKVYNNRKSANKPEKAVENIRNVFYCGHCGHSLRKKYRKNMLCYSCYTPYYQENADCKGMVWTRNDIDEALLKVFSEQLPLIEFKNYGANSQKVDHHKGCTNELTILNNDVFSCEDEKVKLYERYRTGDLSQDGFIDARSALIEKQKKYKVEIKKIQEDFENVERVAYVMPQELKQSIDQGSFENLSDEKKLLIYINLSSR